MGPSEGGDCAFDIPNGVTSLTPYEFCNKHGLHIGEPVTIAAENQGTDTCVLRQCANGPGSADACNNWDSIGSSTKHEPVITISGTTGTVQIGHGWLPDSDAPKHPGNVEATEADGVVTFTKIHYIAEVAMFDQDGKMIAWQQFLPSPKFDFVIPAGTTSVQAIEVCNTHGLYAGPAVAVTEAGTATATTCAPIKTV
eukprot:gene34686-28269_t